MNNNDFYDNFDDFKTYGYFTKLMDRFGSQNMMIFLTVGALIIGMMNLLIFDRLQSRFDIEDTRFTYANKENNYWLFTDDSGNPLKAYGHGGPFGSDDVSEIRYQDHIYTIEKSKNGNWIYTVDGDYSDTLQMIRIVADNIEETSYVKNLFWGVDSVLSHKNDMHWLLFIAGIGFFAFLGALGICRPEILWLLEHWISVEGGEPSDFYIVLAKAGGAVALIFSVIWPELMLLGII